MRAGVDRVEVARDSHRGGSIDRGEHQKDLINRADDRPGQRAGGIGGIRCAAPCTTISEISPRSSTEAAGRRWFSHFIKRPGEKNTLLYSSTMCNKALDAAALFENLGVHQTFPLDPLGDTRL